MRFAFETVIWGRRIHDLDLVLEQIKACGYEGVEFSQNVSDLRIRDKESVRGWRSVVDIHELVRLLGKHGLELVSLAGGPLRERVELVSEGFRIATLTASCRSGAGSCQFAKCWRYCARWGSTAGP